VKNRPAPAVPWTNRPRASPHLRAHMRTGFEPLRSFSITRRNLRLGASGAPWFVVRRRHRCLLEAPPAAAQTRHRRGNHGAAAARRHQWLGKDDSPVTVIEYDS